MVTLPRPSRWTISPRWALWRSRQRRRQRRETPVVDHFFAGAAALGAGLSFSRGSQAWDYGFNAYANDVPRLTASGLLYEEARTNTVSYSRLSDAVVQSTPQTLGTSVLIDGSGDGLTVEVAAVGTEDGVPYIDYRVSGSRTGTGNRFYDVIDEAEVAGVAHNDQDVVTAWIKLVSGIIPADINLRLYRHYRDAANALVATGDALISPDGSLRRYSMLATAPATTAKIVNRGLYVRAADTAAAVDFTIRVGAIQHERAAVASSPIVTAGTQVARAADTLTVSLEDGHYDVLVERADLDGAVTKAFVDVTASSGAGWGVPVDMDRPYLRRLRAWQRGILTSYQQTALLE